MEHEQTPPLKVALTEELGGMSEVDQLRDACHRHCERNREIYAIAMDESLDRGDRLQRIAARLVGFVPQPLVKRTQHG